MMETSLQQPAATAETRPSQASYDLLDDLIDDYFEPTPLPAKAKTYSAVEVKSLGEISLRAPSQIQRQKSTSDLASDLSRLSLAPPLPPRPVSNGNSGPTPPISSRSTWKNVVDETVYFAGGLISHPFESTKRYSILRHSSAIVYYKGPSTGVAISVFADAVLPPDRSFWIQRKGFSGNMGMAASALMRTTSNWIDVTPSSETLASSVPEADERAWQRDIKKFLKRAGKDKRLSKHILRETCVLRIPAEAEDGYLRIVMCTGQDSKKTLCPSPTFRLASTSSDVSVLRGASLTTLPLEVGLKAASFVGNMYAQKVIGPAQAVVEKIQPAFIKDNIGKVTFVQDSFMGLDETFDAERDVTYDPLHEQQGAFHDWPEIVGSDTGPEKPFPIKFDGKVVAGTGQGPFPTANLTNVPEEILLRLNGVYIGWAAIESTDASIVAPRKWHEALITIGLPPYAAAKVVARNKATVHIIHDFGGNTFFNTKLKVMIMAFLRPIPKPSLSNLTLRSEIVAVLEQDKEIAVASLSRKRWHYETSLQMIADEKAQKSIGDRYVGFRSQVQRRVDSIPLHLVGVRTDRAELKDEAYGRGGFYIRR